MRKEEEEQPVGSLEAGGRQVSLHHSASQRSCHTTLKKRMNNINSNNRATNKETDRARATNENNNRQFQLPHSCFRIVSCGVSHKLNTIFRYLQKKCFYAERHTEELMLFMHNTVTSIFTLIRLSLKTIVQRVLKCLFIEY